MEDFSEFVELSRPVAQNYNEIGRLAIELLLHKLVDNTDANSTFPANERILLNAEIMLRQSG